MKRWMQDQLQRDEQTAERVQAARDAAGQSRPNKAQLRLLASVADEWLDVFYRAPAGIYPVPGERERVSYPELVDLTARLLDADRHHAADVLRAACDACRVIPGWGIPRDARRATLTVSTRERMRLLVWLSEKEAQHAADTE